MLRQHTCVIALYVATVVAAVGAAPGWSDQTPADTDRSLYERFEIPIDVAGLPPGATLAPIQCDVDFAELLRQAGKGGAVDERSLRLFHVLPDGSRREQPVQLLARQQPRAAVRQFLPGTVSGVSYLAEAAAGQATPAVAAGGQLCMTRAYANATTRRATLVVANLQYSGIAFGGAYSVLVFGDLIPPMGWLGMALIVGSGIAATVLRARN